MGVLSASFYLCRGLGSLLNSYQNTDPAIFSRKGNLHLLHKNTLQTTIINARWMTSYTVSMEPNETSINWNTCKILLRYESSDFVRPEFQFSLLSDWFDKKPVLYDPKRVSEASKWQLKKPFCFELHLVGCQVECKIEKRDPVFRLKSCTAKCLIEPPAVKSVWKTPLFVTRAFIVFSLFPAVKWPAGTWFVCVEVFLELCSTLFQFYFCVRCRLFGLHLLYYVKM